MSPGGIPVYYYDRVNKEDKLSDAILFTGLMTAIKNFMTETQVGEPEQLSTSTRELYIKNTNCFSVVLIKELNDTIPADIVKDLISDLTLKIYEIIGDDEACNVLDEIQAAMIRDLSDLIIGEWERRIFSLN
jgi:CheY-specific phosphatase CheX